jgi:hypothetical protein
MMRIIGRWRGRRESLRKRAVAGFGQLELSCDRRSQIERVPIAARP